MKMFIRRTVLVRIVKHHKLLIVVLATVLIVGAGRILQIDCLGRGGLIMVEPILDRMLDNFCKDAEREM